MKTLTCCIVASALIATEASHHAKSSHSELKKHYSKKDNVVGLEAKMQRMRKTGKPVTRNLVSFEDFEKMTFDESQLHAGRELKRQKDNFIAMSYFTDSLCANEISDYGILVNTCIDWFGGMSLMYKVNNKEGVAITMEWDAIGCNGVPDRIFDMYTDLEGGFPGYGNCVMDDDSGFYITVNYLTTQPHKDNGYFELYSKNENLCDDYLFREYDWYQSGACFDGLQYTCAADDGTYIVTFYENSDCTGDSYTSVEDNVECEYDDGFMEYASFFCSFD